MDKQDKIARIILAGEIFGPQNVNKIDNVPIG
jgi:hypothetical protein